jgi:acetoin utilization deacetylase AcuC-like enzyme
MSISSAFTYEKKVGIFYDERFLLHDTGPNHPESPERLIPVIRDLKKNNQITSNTIWPNFEVRNS